MKHALRVMVLVMMATVFAFAQTAPPGEGSPVGLVGSPVPGTADTFEIVLQEDAPKVQRGDVLAILSLGGEKVGEATVTTVSGGALALRQKGVFFIRAGDSVRFLKRPSRPATAGQLATESGPVTVTRGSGTPTGPGSGTTAITARGPKLLIQRSEVYIAETGYIRVNVVVANVGDQPSNATKGVCEWKDFHEAVVVRDPFSVPMLQPGQYITTTFFSVVRGNRGLVTTLSDSVESAEHGKIRPIISVDNVAATAGTAGESSARREQSSKSSMPAPHNWGPIGQPTGYPGTQNRR